MSFRFVSFQVIHRAVRGRKTRETTKQQLRNRIQDVLPQCMLPSTCRFRSFCRCWHVAKYGYGMPGQQRCKLLVWRTPTPDFGSNKRDPRARRECASAQRAVRAGTQHIAKQKHLLIQQICASSNATRSTQYFSICNSGDPLSAADT